MSSSGPGRAAGIAHDLSNFCFVYPRVTITARDRIFIHQERFRNLVLLILESLGSTELFFILVMALIFFGPRKLPQLSRTLGKNLASFRRASDDFKRTWYQEVNLEEMAGNGDNSIKPPKVHSSLEQPPKQSEGQPLQPATIRPVDADQVISRQPANKETPSAADVTVPETQSAPTRKSDWL